MSTSNSSDRPVAGLASDPRSLSQVTGHLVRRVHQRHVALWNQIIGDVLTPPQYGVLHELDREGELNLTDLGARAALDRTTVGQVVDRLRDRGLVSTAPWAQDRRHRVVTLTDDGRTLLADVTPLATRVNRDLTQELSRTQHDTLVDLLVATLDVDELEW